MSAARPPARRPSGRHLLASASLAAAIVRDAGVLPGDAVLDIGAGSGVLTRALLDAGASVTAIEPDRRLGRALRRSCPEAELVEADARTVDWPSAPFRVVANLPFALASELCARLLDDPSVPLVSADLVVEWDFGLKRTRVWPSTVRGVLWGAWYELSLVRRLGPESFRPPPSVPAAVIRARRRLQPLVPVADAGAYAAFVGRAFRRGHRARELDAHAWAARWSAGTSVRPRTVPSMRSRP